MMCWTAAASLLLIASSRIAFLRQVVANRRGAVDLSEIDKFRQPWLTLRFERRSQRAQRSALKREKLEKRSLRCWRR